MPKLTYVGALSLLRQGCTLEWTPGRNGQMLKSGAIVPNSVAVSMKDQGLLAMTEEKWNWKLRPMTAHDKVEEITRFGCTDGTLWATMDEACEHQEAIDFAAWCEENICRGGEWSASMVAKEILIHWRVLRKETTV